MGRWRGLDLAFVLLGSLGAACASGSGRAHVQLSPAGVVATSAPLTGAGSDADSQLVPIPATLFQMKILSAYLAPDVDPATMDNIGTSERIWVNPACADPNTCRDSQVDYFDLTDPTEANRQLNAQGLDIAPGAYHYVRVEFCVGGAQGNIIRYQTASMPEPLEAPYGGCGVTSERLEPAVQIDNGSSVTIALQYDLAQEPLYYAQGSETCGSADTPTPCIGGITLTPSVVR